METPSTLIVGYGITGKNLHREIAALNPDTSTISVKNLCAVNIY